MRFWKRRRKVCAIRSMKRSLILLFACKVILLSTRVGFAAGVGFNNKPIADVSARCRSGKVVNCIEAGNRYRFGQNAPMDALLAVEHYEIACRGEDDYQSHVCHGGGILTARSGSLP